MWARRLRDFILGVFSPERSKVAARRAAAATAAAAALVHRSCAGRWMQMEVHQLVTREQRPGRPACSTEAE